MIHGQDHTLVLAVLISVVNFAFHIFSSFTYLDAELYVHFPRETLSLLLEHASGTLNLSVS